MENQLSKLMEEIKLFTPDLPKNEKSIFEEILGEVLDGIKNRQGDKKTKISNILKEVRDELESRINGRYNLIPSDSKGQCRQFCLGIASTGFGTEKGFRGIMRDAIELWFNCYGTNKETLILTADWADEIFNNWWLPIIETYVAKGNKVYIVQYTEKSMLLHYPR
jgi:hypothetical protein